MSEPDASSIQAVRVDRWLWAARFFKTRALASAACVAGHVKLDGTSVKAAKLLRVGQRLDVLTPGGRRLVEVAKLLERRVGAPLAQTLYVDHTPPPPPREVEPMLGQRDRGAGRPDKRERRQLRRLRGR
ncbi:MAG: RNA-binding S4 domain-containing protein [Myxococcales bacterium FL481]|nr:MAG: RNA-binding S4 domain-containing protein [Myxococcales bacterium FL481]